jgi:hypothetical protein
MEEWQVMAISCTVDELREGLVTPPGWEPFGVETHGSAPVIYVRRPKAG